MCKLYTDVTLGHCAASFSGGAKPLAAASRIAVSGTIMTGRQITAAPEQQLRAFRVGKWRSVEIPVSLKGSRALVKVYTDLDIEADDPKVWYNVGLEPIIGLVSSTPMLFSLRTCCKDTIHSDTSKKSAAQLRNVLEL